MSEELYVNTIDFDNDTAIWWPDTTEEDIKSCHACFGTGLDREWDADCIVCYGDGVL